VDLIRDPGHGRYRAYLFWTLPYMKSDSAVDVALEMLDDDEMHLPALRALADLRSERALPVLEAIVRHPRPRGRNDADERERTRIDIAQGGLEKLRKARAKGKSRP
jgi:sulfite reductase beta subunit-like hemoprotein